jgi:hypothetical protein
MRAFSGVEVAWVLFLSAGACTPSSGDDGDSSYSSEHCRDVCSKVAAADCDDVGVGCFDYCVGFPVARYEGSCQSQVQRYFHCFWQADSFSCDAEGQTAPLGCSAERRAYQSCASPGAEGGGGAGGAAGAGEDEASAGGAGLSAANATGGAER